MKLACNLKTVVFNYIFKTLFHLWNNKSGIDVRLVTTYM